MKKFLAATATALGALALVVGVAAATPNGADTLVTVGSPPTPFPQNKQNEPAVAVNPADPTIAAAGVNEEIDLEACNNRNDKTCPFTPGIGTSGIYFSDSSVKGQVLSFRLLQRSEEHTSELQSRSDL